MKIESLLKKLNSFSSLTLQEKWDNSGVQIIIDSEEIGKILLSLDITENVVDFAIKKNCNLIISHHPLFFSGIKSINYRKSSGQIIIKAIQNNINIISLHTNMDKSVEGLADYFCKKINLKNIKPLSSKLFHSLYKVVTFIPEDFLDEFLTFFQKANIEVFKNYSSCSFYNKGTGTFYPTSSANPFLGEKEKLNKVDEIRIEITAEEENVYNFVEDIKKVHPYEIPVIDTYLLKTKGELKGALGRIGDLENKITLKDFLLQLKKVFNIGNLRYIAENSNKTVRKIAVCPGSGMSLINDVLNANVDVYITGDVKYHEALDAEANEVSIIDLGHFNSEFIFTELMYDFLVNRCNLEAFVYPQKDIFKFI